MNANLLEITLEAKIKERIAEAVDKKYPQKMILIEQHLWDSLQFCGGTRIYDNLSLEKESNMSRTNYRILCDGECVFSGYTSFCATNVIIVDLFIPGSWEDAFNRLAEAAVGADDKIKITTLEEKANRWRIPLTELLQKEG